VPGNRSDRQPLQLQGFLYLVGSLFTPLFGVLFADYFLLKRRRYDPEALYPTGGLEGPWGGRQPVALIAGVAE